MNNFKYCNLFPPLPKMQCIERRSDAEKIIVILKLNDGNIGQD